MTEQNPAEVAFSGRCPGCGYDDVSYGSIDIADTMAWQVVGCPRCGAHWSETYVQDSIYIREPGNTGTLTIDDEIDLPKENDMPTNYHIYEANYEGADTLTYLGSCLAASAEAAVRRYFTNAESGTGPRSAPEHVVAIPSANVHAFEPKVETQTRLTL